MDKPRIIEHISKSLNWTINDCKWVPSSAKFVAVGGLARGTNCIQLYQLSDDGKDLNLLHDLSSSLLPPIKCCTFEATGLEERHLACGDFDGNILIYDINHQFNKANSTKSTSSNTSSNQPLIKIPNAHSQIINCIDGCGLSYGPPEIATGSRDGCVKIWDLRQQQKPITSLEPSSQNERVDCWAVCLGNSYNSMERVCCSGYENGDLKIFDLRMNAMLWETNLKNGICSLQFDRRDIEMNKLLATTLEGRFNVMDMRTRHPEHGYAMMSEKLNEQSSSTVWMGRHLPQNRDLFMVASGSGLLSLYKYNYPSERRIGNPPEGVAGTVSLVQKQTVSSQPVCCFDWNRDKEGLAVAGALDQCLRVIVCTKLNLL